MAIDVYKDWLGIPEGPRPPDHYALLRVKQFEDAPDLIRGHYKKLNGIVRRYATGQYLDESQALLNELAKAMLCLTDAERKREYDESLGREFPEDQDGPKTLDQVLIRQKHVTREQAEQAKNHADSSGLELRDAFVQLKMVTPEVATQGLATELGIPYIDLGDVSPEDEVLDRIPKRVVRQFSVLPLFIDNGSLLVACVHQIDHDVEDELRLRFDGAPVRSVLATKGALDKAIAEYYAPGVRQDPGTRVPGEKTAAAPQATVKEEKAKPRKVEAPKPEPKKQVKLQPRTEEEIRKGKQLTIIVVCWSIFGAYLLDNFLLTPGVFFDLWTFVLFTTIPLVGFGVSYTSFMKR